MDVTKAVRASIARDNLKFASQCGAWAIRIPRTKRELSKNEHEAKRVAGSATCFHDLPYTLPCKKCRRGKEDAAKEQNRIKALLSIT